MGTSNSVLLHFFLDGARISWEVKLSPTVCRSTQEAEYYALSEGTKKALNLRMLLHELGTLDMRTFQRRGLDSARDGSVLPDASSNHSTCVLDFHK